MGREGDLSSFLVAEIAIMLEKDMKDDKVGKG